MVWSALWWLLYCLALVGLNTLVFKFVLPQFQEFTLIGFFVVTAMAAPLMAAWEHRRRWG